MTSRCSATAASARLSNHRPVLVRASARAPRASTRDFTAFASVLAVISVVGHRVEEAVGGGPLQVPGLDHVPRCLQVLGDRVEVLLVFEHLSAQSARNARAHQGPDPYSVGHLDHRPISCSHPTRY